MENFIRRNKLLERIVKTLRSKMEFHLEPEVRMTLTNRNREFGNDKAHAALGGMNELAKEMFLSGKLKESETLEYLKTYLENYRDKLSEEGLYVGLHTDPADPTRIHLRLGGLDYTPSFEEHLRAIWHKS